MKEWKEVKFSTAIELIGGGTPKTTISEYWDGDIPWLSVVDFNNGQKYVYDTEKKITEAGFNNSSTKLLKKGDIIISARGTVGVTAVLAREMTFNQSCYGIRGLVNIAETDFIYYLLNSTIKQFKQIAHGGVFDTITRATFEDIDIFLPPLPEQKAIAQVLSSLDDKIELLNQQNKTLEQMAETLFRQWFVEEAEKDWEEVRIGDIVKISSGKGLKRSEYVPNGNFRVLGANGEIGRTNNFLFNDRLLFTGRVGTLGNVFRIENEKVWLSDNTLIIQSEKYFNLLYCFLKSAKLENYNVGSTQPLIRQSDIKELIIYLPTDIQKAVKFETESELYFKKIKFNQSQIQTLTSLRDTLLPKLMSGEVRVDMN